MLTFKKLEPTDLSGLAPYFAVQTTHIADYSLGFLFMWGRSLSVSFGFAGRCLVLMEVYAGKHYFYYPLSPTGSEEEEERALAEIETYCRDNDLKLHYTSVPEEKLPLLVRRYRRELLLSNRRRWRDYLYRTADFVSFSGKKYAGQRNHVHKFIKRYPDFGFYPYRKEDEAEVRAFLEAYALRQREKGEFLADEEMDETLALLPRIGELGLSAGVLTVGETVVGFTVGERCGDMLVIQIEKALREYEGVYPVLASSFAARFKEGIPYLNRMDDAGDMGLRKSKLQYLPCAIVGKYNVTPSRAIDGMKALPKIKTERLELREVCPENAGTYARLARDVERNRYWGYDWREDAESADPPAEYFLECARNDFKAKREVSLGIFRGEELVGETVLHRFGYRDEVELGIRLLQEAEGNGYAAEAMIALAKYAFVELDIERAEAKCFRENERSRRMLLSAGFVPCGEDETYFRFYKTPEM